MLRLRSNGRPVRIVWCPRFPIPDPLVIVESIQDPRWQRQKALHEIVGSKEEIDRQMDRLADELWGGENADLDRIHRVTHRQSRFETLEEIFGTERPEGFQP